MMLTLAALGCVAPRPTALPEPLPPTTFSAWQATSARLSNGLEVRADLAPGADVFYATVAVPTSVEADAEGKEGTAYLFTLTQSERTETRDARALAAALGQLGGYALPAFGPTYAGLSVAGPSRHAEPLLDALAELVTHERVDPDVVQTRREQTLVYLRSGENDVTTIAADVAQHVVWGGAGPGRATRPEAVATITSDDIARWRDRSWGPASAVVLVQGPWTADELVPMLEARLGDWRAPGRAPAPAPPTVTAERVVAVHVPGAAQTSIGVVRAVPALSRPLQGCDAPDCVPVDAARIASLVIGDQRVNHRLREVEGWTYSATCALERYAGGPLFSCSASVQADATVPALRAMREELDGAASRPPSDDDIGRAQRYLVDSARTWDLNAYLDAGLTLWAAGQPVTAVQDRLARTSAMGPDAVRAAAAVLAGAERAWVVVGDLDPHRDEIRALGLPYEEVDRWGEPVPASP